MSPKWRHRLSETEAIEAELADEGNESANRSTLQVVDGEDGFQSPGNAVGSSDMCTALLNGLFGHVLGLTQRMQFGVLPLLHGAIGSVGSCINEPREFALRNIN